MKNDTGVPVVQIHSLEILDQDGKHVRTLLMQGGRFWPTGGEPHHPVHGAGDDQGIIHHGVKS